ncbi:MAG: hypothetical protein Q7S40_11530 [Opitutaceae bacterium]|nr:hypothetical protein [Opitutaceae bacterium]
MNSSRHRAGRFTAAFRARYLQSLHDYRFFYDDISEIGNPATADYIFYFVPGINGTPGQTRFVLPSLTRVFGSQVYMKALHLPEFSARRPVWEKYTPANVDRKLEQLRTDLSELLQRHEHVTVIASSNGFYDFAAAAGNLSSDEVARIHLVWGACAPDHFDPTPWEQVFFPLNGFEHEGHRWFAFPNHNLFQAFNPEASHTHLWRDGPQSRRFVKADLESRFHFAGLEWDYVSVSQIGAMVHHVVNQIGGPVRIPAEALVAANDGYWQGKPPAVVERHIRRYLPDANIEFKPASHLWVVTPSHVTELFERLKHRLHGMSGAHAISRPQASIPVLAGV